VFGVHVLRKIHKKWVDTPKTVGEKLRNKRFEKGLLQKEVAVHLGVSEDTYRFWELGEAYPRIKYFPKIIEFIGYIPIEVDSSSLSGKITLYRHIHGLTYKAFGRLFDVDGSTIRSWELEEFIPSKATFQRVDEWLTSKLHKYIAE
jgi:transcriptional regulator with XRE-family HTH domain